MRLLLSIVTVVLVCLLPGSADAGIARVGRGIITTSAPPIYYVAPSPDDAGVSRMLYRKQDLAGLPPNVPITAIEFDKRLSGALATGALAIYMKNSAATSLPATSTVMDGLAGMTEVFTTTSPAIPAPSGWVRFTLTTPFTYTGDAIEVATVWDAMSGARSDDLLFSVHGTGTAFLEQFNYGPAPLAATDVIARSNPVTRVNTQLIFPDPTPGFLVVEVAKNPLQNGGTFTNNTTFAAGAAVPVAYTVRNIGLTSVALAAVFTNVANMPTPTTSTVPAMLAAGGSVEIVVTHTPIAANVATGYTVTFDTDATDHVINLTGFAAATPAPEIQIELCDENQVRCSLVPTGGQIYVGDLPAGEPTKFEWNVGNIGSDTLLCPADALFGGTNATITVTQQASTSNPAGTDTVIRAAITPTTPGPWATSVRLDCNDASEPSYQFQVSGRAVTATPPGDPELVVGVGGGVVESGDMIALNQGESTFTIGNEGTATLEVSQVSFTSATNVNPSIVTNVMSVPQGQSAPLVISTTLVDASQPGTFQLRILNNDPDASDASFAIDVTIRQNGPDIHVDGFLLGGSFSGADPGPYTFPIPVRNLGNADLHVSNITGSITSMGENGPTVAILGIEPTGFTVAPGATVEVIVELDLLDTTEGRWAGVFTISSDSPNETSLVLEIGGDLSGYPSDPTAENDNAGCCSTGGSPAGSAILATLLLGALVRKPRRHRRLRARADLHG